MYIRELSLQEFSTFADEHFIGNFHQSIDYALLKTEDDFEYEFIGYGSMELKAAALILYKKIGGYYYGYSPRGFLIDYSNSYLLEQFTNAIINYYKNKGFAFIKINPEIAIGKYNKETKNFEYNTNYRIIDNLVKCGYKRLGNNMNFESILPRINAIVNLSEFNIDELNKNTRNKIKKGYRKGLVLEKVDSDKIDIFFDFIKNKRNRSLFYYKNIYSLFAKKGAIDLFLVKIDYKTFLINAQNTYQKELIKNNELNKKLINNNKNIINAKMQSDKALLSYKNDIAEASNNINKDIETYVAGALVMKYQNRVIFHISGFDKDYSRFSPNYFLYYSILDYYKGHYKYADLNGITADLSHENYYYGLNRFKLGFNPDIYEYIGEFDLPINDKAYKHLINSKALNKELDR